MTERLLVDAGLTPGMRVLDFGCGQGRVSLMAASLVGPTGRVVGLDRNADAISIARAAATASGHMHVHFVVGDDRSVDASLGLFDAIVARRVLMYQPDQLSCIRWLGDQLIAGGLLVLQETDGTMVPAPHGRHPLHEQVTGWMWQTVTREGASTSIGLGLAGLVEAAGLDVLGIRAEAVVQTHSQRHPTASIVRALLPLMVAHGVASEAEVDIDTLDERLAAELVQEGMAFIGEMVFSTWARKPHPRQSD